MKDPEKTISDAFEDVIQRQEARAYRKPVRFKKLQRIFENAGESELVSIEEIVKEFAGTSNPWSQARGAIASINDSFEELGLGYYIEHVPAYRIVKGRRKKRRR